MYKYGSRVQDKTETPKLTPYTWFRFVRWRISSYLAVPTLNALHLKGVFHKLNKQDLSLAELGETALHIGPSPFGSVPEDFNTSRTLCCLSITSLPFSSDGVGLFF